MTTNLKIAERWARYNALGEGKDRAVSSSGNFWFISRELYSYTTVIAKVYPGVALISSHKYSVSTSSHQNRAFSHAIKAFGSERVFQVPFIGARGGWSTEPVSSDEDMHLANCRALYDEIKAEKDRQIRNWRLPRCDWEVDCLSKQYANLLNYIAVTGATFTTEPLEHFEHQVLIERFSKLTKWNEPKAVAARERAAARRVALKALVTETDNG